MTERSSSLALTALLVVNGITHFAATDSYEPLIPGMLGSPRAWIYGSGVAELACAGLLARPRTRRVGGLATAALFVAVFPGNVKMALDGGMEGRSGLLGSAAVAWARLPLQVPLVWWALRVAARVSPQGTKETGR